MAALIVLYENRQIKYGNHQIISSFINNLSNYFKNELMKNVYTFQTKKVYIQGVFEIAWNIYSTFPINTFILA